jgi:hypothetical protein
MGVKESSMMNKAFTMLNLSVILFVIIFGATKSDIHNWKIRPDEVIDPLISFKLILTIIS